MNRKDFVPFSRRQLVTFIKTVHGRPEYIEVDRDGTITVVTTEGVEKITRQDRKEQP